MWQWNHTRGLWNRWNLLCNSYSILVCLVVCSLSSIYMFHFVACVKVMAPLYVVKWCTFNSIGQHAWCTHRPRAMTMKNQGPFKNIQKAIFWDIEIQFGNRWVLKLNWSESDNVEGPNHFFTHVREVRSLGLHHGNTIFLKANDFMVCPSS